MLPQLRQTTVVLGLLCICQGCFGEAPLELPKFDPQASARLAMSEYDADNDGAIAGRELEKCPGLKAALAALDKDQDKRLTEAEISARVAQYQADKVGLTSLLCRVTLDGAPLPDAVVTLVPEKFMGPDFKPAKGTTDATGQCSFQIEGEEFPGTQCGIFRVEVSKKDAAGNELLPARYNTNTQLGDDISADSNAMFYGLELKLNSK